MESNGQLPAFPQFEDDGRPYIRGGLTKREYFAALAMGAIVSAMPEGGEPSFVAIAYQSYQYADALINELDRRAVRNQGPR